MTADFSRVQHLFDAQLHEQKLHTAAQLVVMQDGRVVVDCAGGTGRDSNVTEETPLLLFSIS
ncbi:MAG: beta-lactamase family protein, partial [Chloroflexi bacterium]|nr:beta-lactamase family protein [Chloroflexota bacterium]